MKGLTEEALGEVAQYFQALSEPTRLRILNALRDGERNVGELTGMCDCSTANVSRHLALLAEHGMVVREGRGTSVYYRIADASVFALCDLVCGSLARNFAQQAGIQRAIGAIAQKSRPRARRRKP